MAGLSLYAGIDTMPMQDVTATHCRGFLVTAGGSPGLSFYPVVNGTHLPGAPFTDASTSGYPNVNGLYYQGQQNSFSPVDFNYEVAESGSGTIVGGPVTIHWTTPFVGSCPIAPVSPAPVLTATVVDVTIAVSDVVLTWTGSLSPDSSFWSVEYGVFDSTSGFGAFAVPFASVYGTTHTYIIHDVPRGFVYQYLVKAREPIYGTQVMGEMGLSPGWVPSNFVTVDLTGPYVPPTGAMRASWGMIAR